jgi:hypothetical protein
LTSIPFTAALCLPTAALAAMTFLRDAPAEWARDALCAWACIAAMLIAGGTASIIGEWLGLGLLLAAFVALAIRGPWGLLIAAGITAALTIGQLMGQTWPFHPIAAPVLAICTAAGAARSFRLS